jgi:transcriptional regulator with XRE-family HTH domain
MTTTKRRRLVGMVVEAEYARQGMTRDRAAERMNMSVSTLDRLRGGDDRITIPKLRSVEGVLDLPDDLLTLIVEGDIAAIEDIGETEMRPALRRRIMDGLATIAGEQVHDN